MRSSLSRNLGALAVATPLLQLSNDVGEHLRHLVMGAELDHPDCLFNHNGVAGGPVVDLTCTHNLFAAVLVVDSDAALDDETPVRALTMVPLQTLEQRTEVQTGRGTPCRRLSFRPSPVLGSFLREHRWRLGGHSRRSSSSFSPLGMDGFSRARVRFVADVLPLD